MAEYKVDSWNTEQLSRLRAFFAEAAKPGDVVVFERTLAEENVPAHEGLDDDDCNSFVYRAANMALNGLDEARMRELSEGVTLTTRSFARHAASLGGTQDVGSASDWDEDYWEDEPLPEAEVAVMVDERRELAEAPREGDDPEADAWAAEVAAYHNRHHEPV